jgi:D-cysteine desulfhydrase
MISTTGFPPRLSLARLNTPIEKLSRLSQVLGLSDEIWVKRDDLTGAALSGNKIRKLEYLFHEALTAGCGAVVTCGGIQSNHCRATAVAAARLGLRCTVVLRGSEPEDSGLGNLLLNNLTGAHVRWISADDYRNRRQGIMEQEGERWREQGLRPYIIPEGGSNALGACGYVDCVREIAEAEKELGFSFDVVAHAVGSGGTAVGVATGREVYGLNFQTLGFPVCDDNGYFDQVAAPIFEDLARYFPAARNASITFEDGYKGIGYAQSTKEEEAFLQLVARSSGLILDPAYTCKAFLGLIEESKARRFGPKARILFIHTGGLFGTLSRSWVIQGEPPAMNS